jgi:hypothetical protein
MVRTVLAAVLMAVATPGAVWAYDLKTTSSGAEVRWPAGEIEIVLSLEDAPRPIDGEEGQAAAAASLASWQAELAPNGVTLAPLAVAERAATVGSDRINVVRWATDADDPDLEEGVLAMTHVSYQSTNGMIVDADIVVNAAEFNWWTADDGLGDGDDDDDHGDDDGDDDHGDDNDDDDHGDDDDRDRCRNAFDLETTMVHEVGHLLGLSHSTEVGAVMFPSVSSCTLRRDLAGDDLDGIHALYDGPPPSLARLDGEPPGCSAAGSAGGNAAGLAFVLLVLAATRRSRRAAVVTGLAAATLIMATASGAEGAELRWLAVDALAARAELAVRGVVVAQRVRHGQRGPETESTLVISECLAGSCPATLSVVRRGGEIDGIGLWVEGEAEVAIGDDVVVFLRRRSGGGLAVLGGVQGAFRVDARGAAVVLERDLRGQRVRLPDGRWTAGRTERIDLALLRVATAAAR